MTEPAPTNPPRAFPLRPKLLPAEVRLRVIAALLLGAIGGLVVWTLLRLFRYGELSPESIAVVGTALVCTTLVYRAARLRLARKALGPHRGMLCPSCHYPLRALGDQGTCPECGLAYTRPQVVAVWEQWFAIKGRYPRTTAAENIERGLIVDTRWTKSPDAPPWATAKLPNVLEEIERIARSRGLAGPTLPMYKFDVPEGIPGLERMFPADMAHFLFWIDAHVWERFVSDAPGATAMPSSWSFDPGASDAAGLRIRPPNAIVPLQPPDAPAAARPVAGPLHFADGPAGARVCYAFGWSPQRAGTIIALMPSGQTIWLAPNLTHWLARIVAMGGIDPALEPARAEQVSEAFRNAFAAECSQASRGEELPGISSSHLGIQVERTSG